LVDPFDWGEYSFKVLDAETNKLLYSRGFCSVFGEWRTTAEAKRRWGTFHESLRFPWPQRPVQVVLRHRVNGQWQQVWSTAIDPTSRFVTNADTNRRDKAWDVFLNGPPAEKVDIVILGDGFSADDMPLFHDTVQRLTGALFAVEPFMSRRGDFNVRAVDTPAAESGVNRPRAGIYRRSPLGCSYNTFDLARYALTVENRAVRDIAAQVPYDYLIILLNEETYGGGGIYHDQTIVAAHHALAPYVLIHELGHHMAGLADEYYSSAVAYETGQPIKLEPWEPNVTALLDGSTPKWHDLVSPDTPIPTPWNKEAFETRRKQSRDRNQPAAADVDTGKKPEDAAKKLRSKTILEILSANQYCGCVGAFEGARYEAKGLYRPAVNCAMFSRSTMQFCPVCRRAIERVIDTHSRVRVTEQ
jgi:hypothetical protein